MSDQGNRKDFKSAVKKRIKKMLLNLMIYVLIFIFLAVIIIVFSFLASLVIILSRSVGNPNESFASLFQSDFWDTYILLLKVNGITDAIIFSIIPKTDLLGDDE